MSKEIKILLIVEGTKTEPRFFERLTSLYGMQAKIYSVGTNIYLLYQKMKAENFQLDVKGALQELTVTKADKRILDETFTYTYLIYDCDAHHTMDEKDTRPLDVIMAENFVRLSEMAAHFVDETDPTIGKLYINFPMMESYRDCNAFFDAEYCHNMVAACDFGNYKSIAGSRKLANVRIDRYTTENFSDLIRMNVWKLHFLRRNQWSPVPYDTYRNLSVMDEIVEEQNQCCKQYEKVYVLNTALFLLVDYYGNRDGFYDTLMQISAQT